MQSCAFKEHLHAEWRELSVCTSSYLPPAHCLGAQSKTCRIHIICLAPCKLQASHHIHDSDGRQDRDRPGRWLQRGCSRGGGMARLHGSQALHDDGSVGCTLLILVFRIRRPQHIVGSRWRGGGCIAAISAACPLDGGHHAWPCKRQLGALNGSHQVLVSGKTLSAHQGAGRFQHTPVQAEQSICLSRALFGVGEGGQKHWSRHHQWRSKHCWLVHDSWSPASVGGIISLPFSSRAFEQRCGLRPNTSVSCHILPNLLGEGCRVKYQLFG